MIRTTPIDRDNEQVFTVRYRVERPVDAHPCGPRIRTTWARNWIEAADLVRNAYGPENTDRILIDKASVYVPGLGARAPQQVVFYDRWASKGAPASTPRRAQS